MDRTHARLAGAALAALALLPGCSKHEPPPEVGVRHSYTVRGRVVTVPSPDRPIDDLSVRHEAIPDWKDRDGEVFVNSKGERGMKSMEMGFPVTQGVSLEGIEPGDVVEFTFVATWTEESMSYAVTEIRELPPDTALEFDSAPDATGG